MNARDLDHDGGFDRSSFVGRTAALALGAGVLGAPTAAAATRDAAAKAPPKRKLPKTYVYAMPGPVGTINADGPGQNDLNVATAWPAAYDPLLDFQWPTNLKDTSKIINRSGVTGL